MATKRKVCLGPGTKIQAAGKRFCRKISPPKCSAELSGFLCRKGGGGVGLGSRVFGLWCGVVWYEVERVGVGRSGVEWSGMQWSGTFVFICFHAASPHISMSLQRNFHNITVALESFKD